MTETKFSVFRMKTVTFRVLKQITRDKRTFGMIIVMPMIIMLVFGIALTGEVNDVPIVVDNQDQGAVGAFILERLKNDDRVNVKDGIWNEGADEVESGNLFASVLLPSDLSSKLASLFAGDDTQMIDIAVYIDATKPTIRASILSALNDAIVNTLSFTGFDLPIQMEQQLAYNGVEFSGLDVAIPAVMGFVLTFLVMLISLLTMVRENIGGTQFRLFATPLSKVERLMGYVLALTVFGLIEAFAILLISIVVFDATVEGSLLLLLIAGFLYAMVNVLLAVFLSNFAENELQAVQMAPLTALPSMALSGMLVPVVTLPSIAETLSNFVPLTYGIRLFEGIMLKGLDFGDLIYEFFILNLIMLILLGLSIATVKDRIHA